MKRVIDSAIGRLRLTSDGTHLTGLWMNADDEGTDDAPILRVAEEQLNEYFAGQREEFNLPLQAAGTLFQQRVWAELCKIPYGTTISYGDLAKRIGQPTASRAVGLANGQNPISIIVPCHRVIGSTGKLTGYGGGLERKKFLLQHESTQRWRRATTGA